MANELVHGSVGTGMTQAEFEAVGLHVFNSQATGDLLYASSATQLSRLGIGSTNQLLTVIGGVPTWQSTLSGLTFVAPVLGAATATSINSLTITTSAGTLTIANNASAALVTSGNYSITLTATAATNVTLPTTGTLATLAGGEELDNKTLDSSVAKGTWTASGTWTLPPFTWGGTVSVNGQDLDAGAGSLEITTTGSDILFLTGTSAGAGGPILYGWHNTVSPLANDIIFRIEALGEDSISAQTEYGYIDFVMVSPTNTSETAKLQIRLVNSGSMALALDLTAAGLLTVGDLKFGTYTATPATDSTGYITVTDAAGNSRKLMVQA